MGCVLPAGQGHEASAAGGDQRWAAPSPGQARPRSTRCTGSGHAEGKPWSPTTFCRAGSADIVVAGGMESMSNAPYLLDLARAQAYRMGHGRTLDHMFLDGLEDAYDKGRLMGTFAEDCAEAYQFTRAAQDAYAVSSLERANRAIANGDFAWEIAPVSVKSGKSETLVATDEQPPKGRPEKIPTLKPAFRDGGTVTAANSSSISDGAAALILMRESEAEKRGAAPLARIVAHATHAAAPKDFPTAPIGALKKLLEKTGWNRESVDLFEINEAFAVVAMAAMRDLGLPHEKDQQRQRRSRCRARPSDWRLGRAHSGDADRRASGSRRKARRRFAVHRRRRGDGDGDRDGVVKRRA